MDGDGEAVNGMDSLLDTADTVDDRDVLDDVRCNGGNRDCGMVARIGK